MKDLLGERTMTLIKCPECRREIDIDRSPGY